MASAGYKSHKEGCKCYPCRAARGEKMAAKAEQSKGNAMTKIGGDFIAEGDEEASAREVIKATPTHSLRNKIARWKLYRIENPGWSTARIAEEMGLSRQSLYSSISAARKKGLLKLEDIDDKIEHVLVPKVVDNIEHYLAQGDKEMTIHAAKGFGIFRTNQVQGEQPQTVIGIKIEMPPGAAVEASDNVSGSPKFSVIDAEVLREEGGNSR